MQKIFVSFVIVSVVGMFFAKFASTARPPPPAVDDDELIGDLNNNTNKNANRVNVVVENENNIENEDQSGVVTGLLSFVG